MIYGNGMNLENKKILVSHGDSFTQGVGFKLVDGESLEKLKSATSGIPKQAKLFKFTLGAFYLKFHILYVHNYNFCMTRCFCKINWSTDPIIETKNVVLHKGKLKDLDRGN